MDNHFEQIKQVMQNNLLLWEHYDRGKLLSSTIYGEPLSRFLESREDTELMVAYIQYLAAKGLFYG
jgi:hypothetical protein